MSKSAGHIVSSERGLIDNDDIEVRGRGRGTGISVLLQIVAVIWSVVFVLIFME